MATLGSVLSDAARLAFLMRAASAGVGARCERFRNPGHTEAYGEHKKRRRAARPELTGLPPFLKSNRTYPRVRTRSHPPLDPAVKVYVPPSSV